MKTKNTNRSIKLRIKNVRCFAEEQHFDIRPLTFLVGENSTGKTTVMGCFSVIMDCISNLRPGHPDFNKEPYFMGSFQDIATKKLKRDSRSDKTTFEIGCEFGSNYKYNIHFIKQKKRAEPVIQKAKVSFKDFICSVDTQKGLIIKKGTEELINRRAKGIVDDFIYDFIQDPFHFLYYIIRREIRNSENFSKNGITSEKNQRRSLKEIAEIIEKTLQEMRQFKRGFRNSTISLAPIRLKPKRTYDPIREIPDPEGSEIPVTLMRLSGEEGDWKKIHEKLIHFGKTSGLFSDIDVKKYGESVGEPFQLQFQVRGFQSNIMDVGYGVSQILPLLVRLFYPKNSRVGRNHFNLYGNQFLLQQPEVHLHPKAQAEITSLLVESTKNNSFLIETHSDYMIDRASIEIRKKKISPHDVSLIYLEPTKEGVNAHNIYFNEQGDLVGAPEGYRDFFIKESNLFLGFED